MSELPVFVDIECSLQGFLSISSNIDWVMITSFMIFIKIGMVIFKEGSLAMFWFPCMIEGLIVITYSV